MSNFHTGSKFIAVAHDSGNFDRQGLSQTFCEIIIQMDHNQNDRFERDLTALLNLPDLNYFLVTRQRTGVQSEYESVILSEYGINLKLFPAWESEFILWDQARARQINEFIRYVACGAEEEGIEEAITECQLP
jgi:hypothetical protein